MTAGVLHMELWYASGLPAQECPIQLARKCSLFFAMVIECGGGGGDAGACLLMVAFRGWWP